MSFFVYMLRCADGSYYAGHYDNLEARLAAHQDGMLPGYTSSRLPVELVWCDGFNSRQEAFERERQIKGWSRRKKEALIQGDWERLRLLAQSRAVPQADPGPARPEPVEGQRAAMVRQAHHERPEGRLLVR